MYVKMTLTISQAMAVISNHAAVATSNNQCLYDLPAETTSNNLEANAEHEHTRYHFWGVFFLDGKQDSGMVHGDLSFLL